MFMSARQNAQFTMERYNGIYKQCSSASKSHLSLVKVFRHTTTHWSIHKLVKVFNKDFLAQVQVSNIIAWLCAKEHTKEGMTKHIIHKSIKHRVSSLLTDVALKEVYSPTY